MNNSDYKILIVDDEPDLAEIAAETFEMEDFDVTFKLSGEDAYKFFLEQEKVDVIISDAHMPGMKGMELLEQVKNSDRPDPLFYLCTGDVELVESNLIAKGGKGLISKPYSLFDLVERVAKDLKGEG